MNRLALLSAFEQLDKRNQWNSIFNKLRIEANDQERELELTVDESYKDVNFPKNRYQNVLPYDQNRVLLKNIKAGQTDFLNASPLSVPFANRTYILTQGPLQETASDFWQMVWEQNSRVLVMLNNIIEKGSMKCYHYFVDGEEKEKTFGKFKIKLEDEYGTDVYRVRKIVLTALDDSFVQNGEESSRTVSHFHFTNWPDFGVPSETGTFLEFLEKTANAQSLLIEEGIQSPLVVHCSAGIGRSGAYVVVDCVLTYLQNGNLSNGNEAGGDNNAVTIPKSIEEFVLYIRRHRMGLIQTPEQLRFCWQAIVDWLKEHPETGEMSSPAKISARKRQSDPGLKERKEKIEEMRMKLRRVEESKKRWWYRLLHDENTKYYVGSSLAVFGSILAFYVYNSINSSSK